MAGFCSNIPGRRNLKQSLSERRFSSALVKLVGRLTCESAISHLICTYFYNVVDSAQSPESPQLKKPSKRLPSPLKVGCYSFFIRIYCNMLWYLFDTWFWWFQSKQEVVNKGSRTMSARSNPLQGLPTMIAFLKPSFDFSSGIISILPPPSTFLHFPITI